MGLDKTSDFLKAFIVQQDPATPTIFSFAYAGDEAGTGENLFSLGGYAGLDPTEIIWINDKGTQDNDHYRVEILSVSFREHRWTPFGKQEAVVDTGSSAGILPTYLLAAIYDEEPAMLGIPIQVNNAGILHVFNASVYPSGKAPLIDIEFGGTKWSAELADLGQQVGKSEEGNLVDKLYVQAFWPPGEFLPVEDDPTSVPNIIGGPFLQKQKGVVFDFTPNRERVGFVPR
jgi:hypothetical protein